MYHRYIALQRITTLKCQLPHPICMTIVNHRQSGSVTQPEQQDDSDVAILTTPPPKPPMYGVLILNDDYTPMDFVIFVLERFFGVALAQATELMLSVHYNGKAMVGIYPRDIASTKAKMVNDFAREQGHPLLCQVEKLD